MPIYEYECKSCGHRQETIQKMSDDPLVDCPACEKPDLKKLLSAPAFRLKGGGWYETDFKNGNQKNVVKDDKKNTSPAKKESASSSGGCGTGSCGCN